MYLNSINAPIDIWGVGTNLVTAKGDPSLSGVYKMISIEKMENLYQNKNIK